MRHPTLVATLPLAFCRVLPPRRRPRAIYEGNESAMRLRGSSILLLHAEANPDDASRDDTADDAHPGERRAPRMPRRGGEAHVGSYSDESDPSSLLELVSPVASVRPDQMSASSLAYLGDVVYELFVRSRYVWPSRSMSKLQDKVVSVVRG